jgi:hypothetical protein
MARLAGLTDRAVAGLEGKDFGALVERLRRPPPVPFVVLALDEIVTRWSS